MPKVVGYHRPRSVDEALAFLADPGAAVLAGGTRLNADTSGDPVVAVDVQALGLAGVAPVGDGKVRLGAATTLQALVDSDDLPAGLRDLARRELPSTLRTLATVGGTVAAGGPESELVTGLLVHDAVVTVAGPAGVTDVSLPALLADTSVLAGSLVTAVTIEVGGTFAADRTGRTPGDTAIVSAAARRRPDGTVALALSGVAATPVLVTDPAAVDPPGDFRGSSQYRRHLATVLAARVSKAVAQ